MAESFTIDLRMGGCKLSEVPGFKQVEIKLDQGTAVFAILEGSFARPGVQYPEKKLAFEMALRCLVRSGRRYFLSGAVESAITLRFELERPNNGAWSFRHIALDGVSKISTLAPRDFLARLAQGITFPVYEENGTPVAQRIGLRIADEGRSQDVTFRLVKAANDSYYPRFERRIPVIGSSAPLEPFQLLIHPEALAHTASEWTLVQDQHVDVKPEEQPKPEQPASKPAAQSWRDRHSDLTDAPRPGAGPEQVAGKPFFERPIWRIAIENIPAPVAFLSWNHKVAQKLVHYAQNEQAEERISLLPRLENGGPRSYWSLQILAQEVMDREAYYSLRSQDLHYESHRLVPAANQDALLVFDGVTCVDGRPLQLQSKIDSASNAQEGVAGFAMKTYTVASARPLVRIGSLDLEFGSRGNAQESTFAVWFATSGDSGKTAPQNDEAVTPSLRVETALYLALARVAPGGQDPIPGPSCFTESRPVELRRRVKPETALLLPLDSPGEGPVDLGFEGTEDSSVDQSHKLDFKITGSHGLGIENRNYLVLDRAPFLVASVRVPALKTTPPELAVWKQGNRNSKDSADQRGWKLRHNGGLIFDLQLPPQVLGEETIRNGAKEQPDRPLKYRFSPPATVKLRTSNPEGSLATPPWDLHRLLLDNGGNMPGTELMEGAFDLLYGMRTKVVGLLAEGNPTAASPLRIMDLAARFGAPPVCIPEATKPDPAYLQFWVNIYARYASRLSALELRNSEDISSELELSKGLTFSLHQPDDPMFPAGALYGVEFKASLQALMKRPRSDEGFLRRPFLSALGGWGYQKATFANGIISIYSDTAMGRTFYYSVEEVGRIACLWNRAKHGLAIEAVSTRRPGELQDVRPADDPQGAGVCGDSAAHASLSGFRAGEGRDGLCPGQRIQVHHNPGEQPVGRRYWPGQQSGRLLYSALETQRRSHRLSQTGGAAGGGDARTRPGRADRSGESGDRTGTAGWKGPWTGAGGRGPLRNRRSGEAGVLLAALAEQRGYRYLAGRGGVRHITGRQPEARSRGEHWDHDERWPRTGRPAGGARPGAGDVLPAARAGPGQPGGQPRRGRRQRADPQCHHGAGQRHPAEGGCEGRPGHGKNSRRDHRETVRRAGKTAGRIG
jgi:hypothetical protein